MSQASDGKQLTDQSNSESNFKESSAISIIEYREPPANSENVSLTIDLDSSNYGASTDGQKLTADQQIVQKSRISYIGNAV